MESRLDITKVIRTTVDLEILRKLYLVPRQRNLFKKQRKVAFKMDSSSSSCPDDDSDKEAKIFEPNNGRSIMNADLNNITDRRLLLGILHRDNDLEPRKKVMEAKQDHNLQPSAIEMSNVNSNSQLNGGDGGDG